MKDFIKIYSHPRSGTHFLEAFLANNFYKNEDLSSNGAIYFGHWSNKILLKQGEPFHKLFGSHFFPNKSKIVGKSIYIYRDGRDVIASLWNSKFYNKEWDGISFSEYLRKEIDWVGGTGQKENINMNIVQHWFKHTNEWVNLENDNLLIMRYEEVKINPNQAYLQICRKFFPLKYFLSKLFGFGNIDPITNKVGLKPNKAEINSWRNLFSKDDLDFFYSQIPNKNYLYEEANK